jgi:hypothetical protein
MRLIFCSIAPLVLVVLGSGCNTVSPDECWLNTSGGFGGSGTIPIGAGVGATSGDFLEPPRGPLDYSEAPNPCIMPQSPCHEKCLADYEAAAIACGKIGDKAQRKTCADGAYASYKSCNENCQQQSNSDCDEKYQDCLANGPTFCLKKSGGKSRCQRCLERCNAGDSPSSTCRTCKF